MTMMITLALAAVTLILFFGTGYSVVYNTYMDTSHPVLSHLSHHLADNQYFASKSNFLNVYFIKYAWAWTTAAFGFTFFTSPSTVRTRDRILKYLTLTAIWFLFINWFFGPPILDRFTVYSGGECIAYLPSGDTLAVPHQFCFTKSTLSPDKHPELFQTALLSSLEITQSLSVQPKLRKGHDLSGHVFLLTMSILFLADQLKPSFGHRASNAWSPMHAWAVASQIVLITVWLFALYTTAVYFHTPFEKFTGYLLGLASFTVSQIRLC